MFLVCKSRVQKIALFRR